MELIAVNSTENQIIEHENIVSKSRGNFIEANTNEVSMEHLKKECVIPVFAKDNETTISHFQFVNETLEIARELFPDEEINKPDIRVSHTIKGRIPSAIGKPAKELLEHEKTLYYERCAFVVEIPSIRKKVNGNELLLSLGGVRAYNQENLYSKKSLEKFKLFIGFQNRVCTNLCISTDGFSNEIRIGSISELRQKAELLFEGYNAEVHLDLMCKMADFHLTEYEFAHFIGKTKMYQQLTKAEQNGIFPIGLSDSQISNIVRNYFNCPNFSRSDDGSINLWNLYNILTEVNKSSYIDSNFERNVKAYELINNLTDSIEYQLPNYLLAH